MLIILIWLGSTLPLKYLQSLKNCQQYTLNTCVVLQQAHWNYYYDKYQNLHQISSNRSKTFSMVERADILRLLYLYQHGGIYSDLDNTINYPCLYELINSSSEYKDNFYFGEEQWYPQKPSNNFIYSPYPYHPELKKVIQMIHECEECTDLDFASPYFLLRNKVKTFKLVSKCVKHGYDYSWMPKPKNESIDILLIMKIITGVCLIAVIVLIIIVVRMRNERINIQKHQGIEGSDENLSE